MQLDTRAQARRVMGLFKPSDRRAILKISLATLLSLAVVHLPGQMGFSYLEAGLAPGGQACLGILVFAAICWVTEALPAFAVALCVIGLEIAILGKPGGVFTAEGDTQNWQQFVAPWASPIMWLFLGGFVLAFATNKVGLDRTMANFVLKKAGGSPAKLMAGVMALTFVLSMFMSNTATAAMMVAMLAPVASGLPKDDKFPIGLYLSVPVAANIGGMCTLIGSPPNAIVVGELQGSERLDFLQWMLVATPPALILCATFFLLLRKFYPTKETHLSIPAPDASSAPGRPLKTGLVIAVFFLTVGLWMTGSLHNISPSVVSFIPITIFAAGGVMTSKDMRQLPWDVLLLLAGGLALGVGVKATGLAAWIASLAPAGLGFMALIIVFMAFSLVLSNLMSNTATASILTPLAAGLVGSSGSPAILLVLVAVACSGAMCLPISTPPNAVAYASGRIRVKDFMRIGLIMATLIPPIAIPWVSFILPKLQ